jgi:hypothetical protein
LVSLSSHYVHDARWEEPKILSLLFSFQRLLLLLWHFIFPEYWVCASQWYCCPDYGDTQTWETAEDRTTSGTWELSAFSNIRAELSVLQTSANYVCFPGDAFNTADFVASEGRIIRPEQNQTHINHLTLNDPYMGRTSPLTSKSSILYIYSTNIGTE